MKNVKKALLLLSILLLTLSVTGCRKKAATGGLPPVTLTYYKLFENEENLSPTFTKFRQQYPHISVVYKKFTDPEKYLETIVSEIAEGGGPDIISVPNTWIAQNYKKLSPAPTDLANEQVYSEVFVNVAARDNIIRDQEGIGQIYGIPLSVDNLALYYNDSHFETKIPEQGKPSSTWEGLVSDVVKLTEQDSSSLSRFKKSGIALGKGDNISRATDIFYLLLLQNKVRFYNDNFKEAIFAKDAETIEALDYLVSFAEEDKANYSWNEFTSDSESAEKEIVSFATGKTSMIIGYSHLYKNILNQIELQKRAGEDVIAASDVKVTEIPQLANSEDQIGYASYFSETVSRNSTHQREAWLLLTFMVEPENLEAYYKKDFKPTSVRSLIPSQRENPIFAPFINQIGYSTSFPIVDQSEYQKIFTELIEAVRDQDQKRNFVLEAQDKINSLIPNEGAYPIIK